MRKYFFIHIVIFLMLLTGCNNTITVKDVKVIKKITHPNQFYQYQYLSIPESASEEELLSITMKIRERDERSTRETVYNYYIENNRKKKFAVLHSFYGGTPARDTLEFIQHGQRKNLELDNALKHIQEFKDRKKYVVSDSCFGIWRNWANPFTFYFILYKKQNEYYVETFNPDFGIGMRTNKAFREETFLNRIALRYEYQEWIGSSPRDEKNTYRFTLNEFGDITWIDQYGKGAEYVQGVYNYVCACDHQQDLGELKAK